MLVVVSDMLLADGSAGEHNLKPQVYRDFLDQIAAAHAKVRQHKPNSRVTIIYAGGIFELRRTHFWFEQAEHRPWRHFDAVSGKALAEPPRNTEYLERAVKLFTRIMTHENVAPIKSILGDRLADRFGGTEPMRVYLPGSADRLINMHEGLRARVIDFLGLDLGRPSPLSEAQRFPTAWLDNDHGAIVRHGHEFDVYAMEGDHNDVASYDRIPMSDLITTELFARLTYEATLLQPSDAATAEGLETFKVKLQQIDNVRPVSSIVKWLSRHFTSDIDRKLLAHCMQKAVENFNSQDYVKWWLSASGHDKVWSAFDEADRIESLLSGLKYLWLGKSDLAMQIYDKFASYDPYQKYVDHAAAEPLLERPDSNVHFVVYGHTHHAEHVPLGMMGPEGNRRLVHYLNVGSMRPTHSVTRDGRDFFVSESLDFGIFYRADERAGATGPTFELRTVTRSRVE